MSVHPYPPDLAVNGCLRVLGARAVPRPLQEKNGSCVAIKPLIIKDIAIFEGQAAVKGAREDWDRNVPQQHFS
jgi:hypothetical protein